MKRTSFAAMYCSIGRTLEVVGDWWTPLVLRDLALGLTRFDELAENLGIPRDVLAHRLDRLVEHGMAGRRPYSEHPPRHDYVLTEKGRDFVPVLLAISAWGDRWTADDAGPPSLVEHTTCGRPTIATVTCSVCGEALVAEAIRVLPGPGAGSGPGTRVIAQRFAAD